MLKNTLLWRGLFVNGLTLLIRPPSQRRNLHVARLGTAVQQPPDATDLAGTQIA